MKMDILYYPFYLLIGFLLWNFFSKGTTAGMNSILKNYQLITKIYFPREILVYANVLAMFCAFLFEFLVLFILLILFGVEIQWTIILSPLPIIILLIGITGMSLFLSSLYVYLRDLQFIWALILQAGFFLTPIMYPITIFPDILQKILSINPLYHIMTISRDLLLYGQISSIISYLYVIITSIIFTIIGLYTMIHLETRFAEEF
jgi:lipopolysaccharide transport system permease protein